MPIKPITPEDEATFTLEVRKLYREIGLDRMKQVLYEMLFGAKIVCDVIKEELRDEEKKK